MSSRRRIAIAIAVVVLVPVLVPLITLPRAKAGILHSLESSLGRSVQAQAVHLVLMPLPGVELDQVRLGEAPAFGLEDMVMAESATARISLWDLLHGQIVFSRLHLQSPSINLVRNRVGQWNIAALLNNTGRAARASGAGHAAPRRGAVRFPYVDWSDARVNFKFDQTETHFYLDQVQGSLARERNAWRLHVSFVPARSDLNLSNTGVVTFDGRWHAQAGSLQQAAFDLVVHLRSSYLAGSSALLFGHDAGVHGVLSAALRLQGTGERFSISGTATAQSLRRWDLLPTSAQVRCSFAAVYVPRQDRLSIEGIGDPGWHQVRLAGVVQGLFSRPRANLSLQVHDLPAAELLPLAVALKAHLPGDLAAQGTVNGSAQLQWSRGQGLPRGKAAMHFLHIRLADSGATVSVPAAELEWNGHRLRLPVTRARLATADGTQAALEVAGELDRGGVSMSFASPGLTSGATAALVQLLGLRSPWPPAVEGTAGLRLRLTAAWHALREAQWSGAATFAHARFQPTGGGGLELRPLQVSFDAGHRLSAQFQVAALPLRGSLRWQPDADSRFAFTGRGLHWSVLGTLLRPAPGGMMQRMFGAVLGSAPPAPAWLSGLHSRGSVRLDQLVWHGIPVNVDVSVEAAPGAWRASRLQIEVAHGAFQGQGRLEQGTYRVRGTVPGPLALDLATLLAPTPDAGLAAGRLSGSLELERPLAGGTLDELQVRGAFLVRNGMLRTATGPFRFRSCAGLYDLAHRRAALRDVRCRANGLVLTGSGTINVAPSGALSFSMLLDSGTRRLRLRSR
ncbi:MAG: AsmA family protein [Terriglobales bacterium]